MNYLRHVACSLAVCLCCCGCGQKPNSSKAPKTEPAQVAHHVDEAALNTITLTSQAQSRLGIQLVEVQRKPMRRMQQLGGDVMLPPGKTITITAPIAGTIAAPNNQPVPTPGKKVTAGQAMLQFEPLLSPEREVLTPSERVAVAQTKADIATVQLEAQRQIESAKVSVEAAQIAFDRAEQLFNSKAGSKRLVDEAQAQLQLAKEALQTAEARSEFLSGIDLNEAAGKIASRTITSPVAGILQSLEVAPGELVAAGELLFSVLKTEKVWIRVPVYVGQWREVDTEQPALVGEFGSQSKTIPRAALYVAAPPSANPIAMTVDVFYSLDNEDGALYPGQKLSVNLPLRGRDESLVVPFAAVLYDVFGGQWVYAQQEDHVFARQRVSVEYVDGDVAVLVAGPKVGVKVVTDGAAELFGTEFGVGH